MKKLLKKLFPILFLRRISFALNTVKIKTLDRLLYGEYKPQGSELRLFEQKNPFLDSGVDTSQLPDDVQEGFSRWHDPTWMQDQYILEIKDKPVFIDPHWGWGMIKSQLIYFSLGFARAPYVRKPDLVKMMFGRNVKALPKVISLRDTGEENYFHFYNDILSKLLFLRDHNLLDKDAYIVVSKRLWNKEYFQVFVKNSWLQQLNWYVQGDEWVQTNHAIFCKPYTHTKKYLAELSEILPTQKTETLRVLLTRGRESLRFVENEEEIFSILARHGFRKIDTTHLTIQQQAEIFSNASHVVAVHGAGITNIIFRKGNLSLLELFHWNEYLPFHYIMLARIFGFDYAAVRGKKGQQSGSGGFYIDPRQVEAYCNSTFT